MKNNILLFATFILISFGVSASTIFNSTLDYYRYNRGYGESFTFVEKGITFAVYQNGEFDFYINPRRDFEFGILGKNVDITFNSGYNYNAYVQYDNYGAVIQVENVPIYYDYYGRVTRIGHVDVNYTRNRLYSVGGLYVHYDYYGYFTHYTGYINRYNRTYVYHPYHNYFARPLFDFRIVSYKPYRHHYKPHRYAYYRNHSKNNYYGKRSNKSARSKITTRKVPKKQSDAIARTGRHSQSKSVRNRNSNSNNNVTRRTTPTKRTNRNSGVTQTRNTSNNSLNTNGKRASSTQRTSKNTSATPQRRSSSTNSRSVRLENNKVTQKPSTNRRPQSAVKRTPVKKQDRKTTVPRTHSKLNKDNSRKTSTTRKPVKRDISRNTNSSRRRG